MTRNSAQRLALGAAMALVLAPYAYAQNQLPVVKGPGGNPTDTAPMVTLGFKPDATPGASLSVTTASANVALPGTGPTVVVTNTGSVAAFVALGGSGATAATTGVPVQPGCALPLLNNAAATYLAAITASGSTTIAIATGQGSAGAACSAPSTQPVSGTVSVSNLPTTVSTGAGATGASSPRVTVAQDATTVAGSSSLPAGAAVVGKVGIDQTTPGTTNAVQATNLPTTVTTNKGASDASTLRVALGDGTQVIGSVDTDHTTPGTTDAITIYPTNAAGAGVSAVTSSAAESNHVFCSAACNVYSVMVTSGAVAGWALLFDATSAPVDGAVTPLKCVPVGASASISLSWRPGPLLRTATGLVTVFSTTGCFTKTASATAVFSAETKQ